MVMLGQIKASKRIQQQQNAHTSGDQDGEEYDEEGNPIMISRKKSFFGSWRKNKTSSNNNNNSEQHVAFIYDNAAAGLEQGLASAAANSPVRSSTSATATATAGGFSVAPFIAEAALATEFPSQTTTTQAHVPPPPTHPQRDRKAFSKQSVMLL